MLKKIIAAAVLAVLLSGCSALTARQSLIADENWYQLGFNNGKWGEKAVGEEALQADARKVSESLVPDYQAYLQGYQKGLESYCTLEQVRRFGVERKMDWGVCEFRREEGGLYLNFWQQGFDRGTSMSGAGSW